MKKPVYHFKRREGLALLADVADWLKWLAEVSGRTLRSRALIFTAREKPAKGLPTRA